MKIAIYGAILIAVAAAAPATLEGVKGLTPETLDGIMKSIARTAGEFTPKTDAEREALNKILEAYINIVEGVYHIDKALIDIKDAASSVPAHTFDLTKLQRSSIIRYDTFKFDLKLQYPVFVR